LANPELNVLITGDLAFFYDRNAFWHNYPMPNLKIVLLNNHGGIIFKMIDGPGDLPESDEYFVTNQKLNGKKLCEEFGFDYLKIDNKRKIKNLINDFLEPGSNPKVLEIETSSEINKTIYQNFKNHRKKSYEV
jgi:2-succinyl-5-enolpyruvyl-6-hydroxy-3-cyclohexene-1-carboxylate synthase